MRHALLLILIAFSNQVAQAITWVETEVEDPISGAICEVDDIGSHGSYVFDYPSKYEGIYFPFTDSEWMWFCPESGYAAFASDFEGLDEDEVVAVRGFLAEHYTSAALDPEDPLSLLRWMERIYEVRDEDDEFWAHFHRVAAFWYAAATNRHRAAAFRLLKAQLDELPPGSDRIHTLFVLGEYRRRWGDFEQACDYFQRAMTLEWTDESGEHRTGTPYHDNLIVERRQLIPGGCGAEADPGP